MVEVSDFVQRARTVAERIEQQLGAIQTEEATKHSFVLPVLQALGYDVFNALEVVPEFTADVGVKKGEKVDYAILADGKPVMLFECKAASVDLGKAHGSQLFRYFTVTPARIGVLTNGLQYQFFADLEDANVMDQKPFLEVDIRSRDPRAYEEMWTVARKGFVIDDVIYAAFQMKYTRAISRILNEEFREPSPEFVKFFTAQVYDGPKTKSVLDRFAPFIKKAIARTITDRLMARIQQPEEGETKPASSEASGASEEPGGQARDERPDDDIMTTEDELMAFYAVKSILAGTVNVRRVTYRDAKSYCSILLDNTNRKQICRLHFNGKTKFLGLFDEEKRETRHPLEAVDDIYNHAAALRGRVEALEAVAAINKAAKAASSDAQEEAEPVDEPATEPTVSE